MKEILKSTWARWIAGLLAAVIVFFVAFGLGVSVGYQKAIFSSEWGKNYERNFSGMPPPVVTGITPLNTHGAVGTVIDVTGSGMSVRDDDNDEQSIIVASDTVIKEMNATVLLGTVGVGDRVVVIGVPNSSGQVEARFVRVFPVPGPGNTGQPQP